MFKEPFRKLWVGEYRPDPASIPPAVPLQVHTVRGLVVVAHLEQRRTLLESSRLAGAMRSRPTTIAFNFLLPITRPRPARPWKWRSWLTIWPHRAPDFFAPGGLDYTDALVLQILLPGRPGLPDNCPQCFAGIAGRIRRRGCRDRRALRLAVDNNAIVARAFSSGPQKPPASASPKPPVRGDLAAAV